MYEDKATLLETKKPRNIFNFSLSREQFKLMIIIMLQSITPGMAIGFSAIALPELKLDLNSSTWFASLPTLGSVFSNFMIGYTMDKYGRKKAFLLGTVMAFTGCILLAGPPDILQLFIGQFCVGLSQGAATLPTTVYVAESIAPNNLKFRSSLSSWNVLAINVGICLVYLFGCFFHYNYVALIGAAISFTSTILVLIFIPESPAWLNQKGRFKEAEVARYQLGFKDASIESVSPSYESIEPKDDESLRSYLSKLKRKDVYKPLFITIVFFFFQQYSGTQVFSAYMVDIISVKFLTINPYVLTVISGFILIVGQVTYTVTLPHIGTKKMAIISCVGSGATVLLLAISIALNETANWYSYLLDCIHILAVWFNVFFGAIGIATIPYTIMAEIFPKDAKGLASISVFGVAILYFSILMIYPYMLVVSPYVVYLCFSFVSFTSVIFIYKFIPETVDRTLNEITSDFWR